VAGWEDVVATGLIGTDRRPVPDQLPPSWGAEPDQAVDPAHVVLSLAARHRALNRAGGRLASCPPGPAAPPNREPVASRAAHEILVRLLSPPQIDLLNLWLRTAADHGQRASAAYWTPMAMVAARTADLDRMLLARVVGDRGVWFIEQNPQWARLAKDLRSDTNEKPSRPNGLDVDATEEAVRADPELIMRVPPPWSSQVTRAVLDIIASGGFKGGRPPLPSAGQLQQRSVRYAAAVGARLPLGHYELLRSTVQQIVRRGVALPPAGLRSVREALLALERTVWLRIEMHSAFSGEPITVQRLDLPQW
jgi:hypothetical protein